MPPTKFPRNALEKLAATARERLRHHPLAHLLEGRKGHLELELRVPYGPASDGALDDAVAVADKALDDEIEALLKERSIVRPGRIHCLRCGASDCEHAAPATGREIFSGYGANGLPRFVDFAQWLLERQHPRLDRIYETPPRLVAEVVSGEELCHEVLEPFREEEIDHRIHGQVVAGWFRVPRADKTLGSVVLGLQILSTRDRRRGRRFFLNVLGAGPEGEPLEELYARLDDVPWQAPVQWGQQVLGSIEKSQGAKKDGKTKGKRRHLERRVDGILQSIARRLEQGVRSRDRRTGHAEKRHHQGNRPTRMAHADLARAADDQVFVDERRKTLIVLGERGRAHVFSRGGKLVTSLRTSPEAVERKKRHEIWRPATPAEAAELRKAVETA